MGFVLNFVIFSTLFVAVILFAPGLPPKNVKFESYELPPPRPFEGKLAKNSILDLAKPVPLPRVLSGPESIAIRGDELYTGLNGGELVMVKNGKVTPIAKFGNDCAGEWDHMNCGRIAGVRFAPDGKLIAADVAMGIFRVDVDSGLVEQLVSMNRPIEGVLPKYPDDLDIAKDGTIYWSDASTVGNTNENVVEVLGAPTGRLVKTNPKTKESSVVLNGLHFANGVQLSKDEDFILVSDLAQSRVLRHYLKGTKKGQTEVFVDRLPGLPDNIRPTGKGGFYICLIRPRTAEEFDLAGAIAPLPLVRKFILRTVVLITSSLNYIESNFVHSPIFREWIIYIGNLGPLGALENTDPKVTIVETDENGNILGSLQNEKGPLKVISEINVGKEYTYFGSPAIQGLYRMKTADLRHGNNS